MRVLFTTTGHAGHALPVVRFARACRDAGHHVVVATQRSRTRPLEHAGLDVWAFDEPRVAALAGVVAARGNTAFEVANESMIRDGFGRLCTRTALPGVLAAVESLRPQIVVRESYELAGALAAERYGIPHIRVEIGPASTEERVLALMSEALAGLRPGLGLVADHEGRRLRERPAFTLYPEALDAPVQRLGGERHRFRHPTLSSASVPPPARPHGDAPLVYLSFGTVAASLGYFPGLYRAAVEALAPLPIRLLVSTGGVGDPARIGPLAANVHAEWWADEDRIAAHAAVVVCHGGPGSILRALAHGVPLVLLPLFGIDQQANARSVVALGAGVAVEDVTDAVRPALAPPRPETVRRLADGAETVIGTPGPSRAARQIAAEIAMLPELETAPAVLEAVAESFKARGEP